MIHWTPEEIERLRSLAATGQSGREIADALGTTRGAVIGKASRSGIKLSGAGKFVSTWSSEDDAKLRRLLADGCTDSEVAKAMMRTPEAVRGRRERLGLPINRVKKQQAVTPEPAKETAFCFADKVRLARKRSMEGFAGPKFLVPPPVSTGGERRLTLMEMEPHHCRYPLWTGRFDAYASHYCGQRNVVGRAWCAEHVAIVFAVAELSGAAA